MPEIRLVESFEGCPALAQASKTGYQTRMSIPAYCRQNPVRLWIFTCCGMIFVMALLGAITRLTQSGLSIVTWDPIIGILPPLSDAEWHKAFDAYKTIPQYQIFNRGMTLEEFKGIFFWEWVHRLWGRMISLVLALPLIYFAATKRLSRALFFKLFGILVLGGLQGFIGWFMVQSGLETRTSVSPYRLALHLSLALLLYALLLWVGLNEGGKKSSPRAKPDAHGLSALALLCITILWGAFVAGLHAGEAYNTWPLMEGQLLPDAAWTLEPAWINAFENLALVQFIHRWVGPTTMIVLLSWVVRRWKTTNATSQKWLQALGVMSVVQVMLGLSTLLTHVNIPIAVTHQAGAMALLTLLIINLHRSNNSRFCGEKRDF
jgi:cytochrome c oxidase assembly protein subunit 15